jgi:uncharacterized protein (DUF433 family)
VNWPAEVLKQRPTPESRRIRSRRHHTGGVDQFAGPDPGGGRDQLVVARDLRRLRSERRGLAAWLIGVTSPLKDLTSMIETRPGVRSGKPCFVGTRIAVYDVLEYLASGMTSDEIVHNFPELTDRHVQAAIEFAAMRGRRLATPA